MAQTTPKPFLADHVTWCFWIPPCHPW